MDKYQNLKKNKKGFGSEKWTIENIRDGFEYFKELNGRYPSSREIDSFEYLPTRRMVERNFGGLVNLRKTLNIEGSSDYTKGEVRSETAKKAFIRAQKYEKDFYYFLTERIPEVRVHEHKIVRPGNTASDFFIYTNNKEGIMVDLFYAQDIYSLVGIVRIKSLKCVEVNIPVYFVLVGNNKITQEQIDEKIKNMKTPLLSHIKVMTEKFFKSSILDSIVLEPLNN